MCVLKVILIGGSSNVGKSTLAEALAHRLGGRHESTDFLARHPGRPWREKGEVPQHVAEHYLSLSVDELIEDVLRHYKSLQPAIQSRIVAHTSDDSAAPLILEGSALWPEFVAPLEVEGTAAVWLTAGNSLFETRISNGSQIEKATGEQKVMVQKFMARTLRYNQLMMEAVDRLGLPSINVASTSSLDDLCDRCLRLLEQQLGCGVLPTRRAQVLAGPTPSPGCVQSQGIAPAQRQHR